MITISMHDDICSTPNCPHHSDCYCIKRNKEQSYISDKLWQDIIQSCNKFHAIVYYSLCNKNNVTHIYNIAKTTLNFNVTLGYYMYKKYEYMFKNIPHRLQITVYKKEQINELKNKQKLFFVKDKKTYRIAKQINEELPTKKIHFSIKRDEFNSKQIVDLIKNINCDNITYDSCLENAILRGSCIYNTGYLDISTDGTFRKCPFNINGKIIGNKTLNDMINTKENNTCQFIKEFGEKK